MCKQISISLLFLLPLKVAAATHPTALELLDKYAANQDKLGSFIAKTEQTITSHWSNKQGPNFHRWVIEFRLDGKRKHLGLYIWDDLPAKDAPTPIENALHYCELWDGKRYFEYSKPMKTSDPADGTLYVSADPSKAKYTLNICEGLPFLGVRYSYSERIDSVLRQAGFISVRDELEQVGSVACYVIDAKATSGTYTVWLDPDHGYSIAKADVRVGPNDFYRGRQFKDNQRDALSIKNVRFEQVDNVWIPMEADLYRTSTRQDGPSVESVIHQKITQITLNPDHDALASFVPVTEKGTEIILDSGVRYTWQEGMQFVVDEWDGSIKYVPKDWAILVAVGKPLPKLDGIELTLTAEQTENRAILLCFLDMNQRPSRHCITQLAQKAAELKERGVIVVAVQATQVEEKTLSDWTKKYNISFPVGTITADVEKTRFAWGVRSLPWLILADKKHVVRVEGFAVSELDGEVERIKAGEVQP